MLQCPSQTLTHSSGMPACMHAVAKLSLQDMSVILGKSGFSRSHFLNFLAAVLGCVRSVLPIFGTTGPRVCRCADSLFFFRRTSRRKKRGCPASQLVALENNHHIQADDRWVLPWHKEEVRHCYCVGTRRSQG